MSATCARPAAASSSRIDNGKVTSIKGNPDDPLSRGYICPKGVSLADIYTDPDRLRRPVRRDGDHWVEIGWDEAFDLVADGLASAINQHGRNAIGVYLGNPIIHSLGGMTHAAGMVKTLGTRNRFSATSVDQLPHQLVAHLMYGHQLFLPIPDIDRTSFMLVFGANPMASNGSLMTVPDFPNRLRELKARGGRMVVFDPRRTETAKVATEHHFVRPGSDAHVLLALLNVVFDEGLTTPPSYVDGLDAAAAAVADFTPEAAEAASGIPADEIRRLARDFAAADGAAAYGRIGVSTQGFGTICQWAIQVLNLVTGNLDQEGGTMFTTPAIDAVGTGLIGRGHHGAWKSRVRGLPESGGELPVSVLREEITTPGEGQIRAMLTLSGNPVLSTPDGARLDEALLGLDFMAAVDIYLNETTRHADVILPPTSALERDHYDLVFHLLAVRNTARFTPAVFAKPKGARHDWEIYREVALRTMARLDRKPSLRTRLQGAGAAVGQPDAGHRRAAAPRCGPASPCGGCARSQPASTSGRCSPARSRPGCPPRASGSTRRPHWSIDDLARLRAEPVPDDDELLLIGRRHKPDCNSWMHNAERLTRGKPRHQLFMHPDDLLARGIDDGATVAVTSRVGKVEVDVLATDDVMPGVVSLPHGYGHQVGGTRMTNAETVVGVSINDLTDPERLDVSGNAALSGVPVTVSGSGA